MSDPILRRCMRAARSVLIGLCALSLAWAPLPAFAAASSTTDTSSNESPWPYTVRLDARQRLLVYPPQIDSWDGFSLQARAAVEMREDSASGTVADGNIRATYGIVQLEARTWVNKGSRRVTLDQYRVLRANFPSASAAQAKAWADALQKDAEGRRRVIALDRLEAQVRQVVVSQRAQEQPLKNEAPAIIFSHRPAILVSIDGAPRYGPVQGSALERVLNTRVLLLRDAAGRHYLHVFDGWLSASSLEGDWSVLPRESAALARVRADAEKNRAADLLSGITAATGAKAPQPQKAPTLKDGAPGIFIAARPSELLVSAGDWSWIPIAGTSLLYVGNTTGHIFRDTSDQQIYVLISGRWFRSFAENGPWNFVPANALPADFVRIPDDSAKENVKASVAGTPQAREAAIAATVAQTGAIRLSQARLAPIRFDGPPQWAPIAGTPLHYAINTPTPLIEVDSHTYYALDNGVWFTASSSEGPWVAATSVPAAIYGIPPSSPLHYVTYVRIFGNGPDMVYEGYSSGYQGAYIDPTSGVVVYGTGYVYDPWIGTTWIGAPATYGYGAAVTYTPWTGWFFGFCFGWAWGAATSAWGWGWGPYPYWGPWGWGWGGWWGGVAYGPFGGAAAWGPGGWAGFTGPIYQRWGPAASVSRASAGFDAWTGNRWAGRTGVAYNSRTGVAAAGQRGVVNNIYTGNFAAGGRGVAVGPGGTVAAGGRAVVGNVYTGNAAVVNRGAVYNPATGRMERVGGVRGEDGGIGHVGSDIYAGHDGNVYRNTGSGWEKHTDGGWQPVDGRTTGGGPEAPSARGESGGTDLQQLNLDHQSRQDGSQRSQQLQQSKRDMDRSFGAGRLGGGFHGAGFHGGFRGRR